MNTLTIMGRLTADPEKRQTESGKTVTRYRLAVNRISGNEADFFSVVAFDRAGDFAAQYFHKGLRVLVSGRVQTGSYTNREGQKVPTWEVIAGTQEFADSKQQDTRTEPDDLDGEDFPWR